MMLGNFLTLFKPSNYHTVVLESNLGKEKISKQFRANEWKRALSIEEVDLEVVSFTFIEQVLRIEVGRVR